MHVNKCMIQQEYIKFDSWPKELQFKNLQISV